MTTHLPSLIGENPVHRVGFGAMQLAGPGVFGPHTDPERCRAVLRRAIELGVDHIDTSQFYGPDVVNELIHDALHPYPENLRLVTKVGARRDGQGAWLRDDEPASLKAQVEENLRTLGVERLSLVNLRRQDLDGPGNVQPDLDVQLQALAELRDDGKIDMIGVSNASIDSVRRAIETVGIGEVQNPFSILDQSDRPVLELTGEHGVAYVPYFPLGSAFTGGPAAIEADPSVQQVAGKHGVAGSQVALAWVLAQGAHVLLIPGTSSIEHLEDNMRVADVVLDQEDLTVLAGFVTPEGAVPGH
jgi:aryl-alcohol dehydrogenase-like predicted oxidoreductase